jgi:hypothetical protein
MIVKERLPQSGKEDYSTDLMMVVVLPSISIGSGSGESAGEKSGVRRLAAARDLR